MISGKIMICENDMFKIFRRKEYHGQDLYLVFSDNDLDKILVSNMYSNRSKNIDHILESCLEIIDTVNHLEENGGMIEPWQYVEMVISENEYMLYYELEKYIFEIVDDKKAWAEDLCKDLGYMNVEIPWFIQENINWIGVADNLLNDYYVCNLSDDTLLIWRE